MLIISLGFRLKNNIALNVILEALKRRLQGHIIYKRNNIEHQTPQIPLENNTCCNTELT